MRQAISYFALGVFVVLFGGTARAQDLELGDFTGVLGNSPAGTIWKIEKANPNIRFLKILPTQQYEPNSVDAFYQFRSGKEPVGEYIPPKIPILRTYPESDGPLESEILRERPLQDFDIIRLEPESPKAVILHEYGHYVLAKKRGPDHPQANRLSILSASVDQQKRFRNVYERLQKANSSVQYGMILADAIGGHVDSLRHELRLRKLWLDEENQINEFLMLHLQELGLSEDEGYGLMAALHANHRDQEGMLVERLDFLTDFREKVAVFPGPSFAKDLDPIIAEYRSALEATRAHERTFIQRAPSFIKWWREVDRENDPDPTDFDLFARLGLDYSQVPTTDDVKKAYKRLAEKYHPDRNPDDEDAALRMKGYGEAYAALKDETKREAYQVKLRREIIERSVAETLSAIREERRARNEVEAARGYRFGISFLGVLAYSVFWVRPDLNHGLTGPIENVSFLQAGLVGIGAGFGWSTLFEDLENSILQKLLKKDFRRDLNAQMLIGAGRVAGLAYCYTALSWLAQHASH